MPQVRDVARWRAEVDGFEAAYRAARATRVDVRVDAIAKNTRDMRDGTLDVAVGREVNSSLKWLAGTDAPNEYRDKPLIDARTVNATVTEDRTLTPIERARAILHTLHVGLLKASKPDARPEETNGLVEMFGTILGRPTTMDEIREQMDMQGGWAILHSALAAKLEGRPWVDPRKRVAPERVIEARPEPIEEAEVVEPEPTPERRAMARAGSSWSFDPADGRLHRIDVGGRTLDGAVWVALPGGRSTSFHPGPVADIEERLRAWQRDDEGAAA
jgi:hypothetical protein